MVYIKSYKELIVWQKSIELVKEVFLLTQDFPKSELYGITSQMRRAAISIPSNIAEAYGRGSLNYSINFYSIAYGSALELETQLIIAEELELQLKEKFSMANQKLLEVLKMLNVMVSKMKLKTKEKEVLISTSI
jgi:four helix bundle protein